MNIQGQLAEKVSQALLAAGAPANSNPQLRPASKPQFGDYQVNGIMAIAKQMGIAPRLLAQQVIDKLALAQMAEKVELAGPGFINIFLATDWLAQQLTTVLADQRLAVSKQATQTIVVDYSAPNVAKEMHVGHLRSTIIGDAMVRILTFLGHQVIRANHVGDWGTQFGMLIAYLEQQQQQSDNIALADLEAFYRQAKQCYDNDAEFATRARHYVVQLQQGDSHCRQLWQQLVDVTMQQNQLSYQRLNVTLTRNDVMGESLYNDMLPAIVADLQQRGIAQTSEGAIVVYLDEFKNKEGEPMGVIIQKKDGGYLYTTTDIACAKYRYETLGADRILYYIDSRQHQHLQQAWSIVRKAGYVPENVPLEHHMFGMMLGKDGKPFKTRAGGTIKLTELLDEAVHRAQQLIASKNPQMDSQLQQQLAETIGIGAVKYADLSKNRTTDYIFDWDNMLSLEGNTAPYIQYAYSRVMSIFSKLGTAPANSSEPIQLENSHEKQLAVRLLQFNETLDLVAQEGYPHLLCNYLYDIATLFSSFYEHCPILTAEQPYQQHSRLQLASLTAKTLQQGLDLLGINTVQRM